MGTQTQRRTRASRTMARTGLDSYPVSPRAVHSRSPSFCIHLLYMFAVDAFRDDGVHSVTAVGGTVSVPEVAADFSGGGFSNVVSIALLYSLEYYNNGDGEKTVVPAAAVSKHRREEVSPIAPRRHLPGTLQSSRTRTRAFPLFISKIMRLIII
jgi:hypothetical protein